MTLTTNLIEPEPMTLSSTDALCQRGRAMPYADGAQSQRPLQGERNVSSIAAALALDSGIGLGLMSFEKLASDCAL